MKVGDRLSVSIEGIKVAEAVVENIDDGVATIVIPATRLQAAVKQILDLEATGESDGPDRVLGGLDTGEAGTSAAQESVNTTTPVSQVGEGIHGKELDSSIID